MSFQICAATSRSHSRRFAKKSLQWRHAVQAIRRASQWCSRERAKTEGYDADTSRIRILCGGHVTPPLGPSPVYRTASTCDHIEVVGQHGPLTGFANDGFAIYDFHDIDGPTRVGDECNGHFGPVSNERLKGAWLQEVVVILTGPFSTPSEHHNIDHGG